jgi:hypothetical protein
MNGIIVSIDGKPVQTEALAGIIAKQSASITIAFHSHITMDTCNVSDPAFIQCQLDIIQPNGNKIKAAVITGVDVWGEPSVLGITRLPRLLARWGLKVIMCFCSLERPHPYIQPVAT